MRFGMEVERLDRAAPEERHRLLELMRSGGIVLVIDIPENGRARNGAAMFRQTALRHNIPYYTTVDGAQALIGAIEVMLKGELEALTLQEHHRPASPGAAAAAA